MDVILIDEAIVAFADGRLAAVERVEDQRGRVLDRAVLVAEPIAALLTAEF